MPPAPPPFDPVADEVLVVGDEVAAAQAAGRPVVALESTIFSALGLPAPASGECLRRCEAAVRAGGAVPALTGVLDGRAVVGAEGDAAERLLAATHKVAARDLAVAVASGLEAGVTTVSASVTLAAAAGVAVFATGGIGGVHRGAAVTGDVSHDLVALARHPVVTVSAGAKAFLDLPRTLELLETLGVPVVGWRTDRFPAFYVRDGGLGVPHRADDAATVARLVRAQAALGHPGGVLVVNPVPAEAELDPRVVEAAIDSALADAADVVGPEVTPRVLAAIAAATGRASVDTNVALAESNAAVAAAIAGALAAGESPRLADGVDVG
ncbi:MAG: pseudouridine-5'-phosphate glycosidase [Actinomyces sp.]|nr:MAG: pseudouridine-5'-phosphate glycosidase [Actinomyces sp.]